MSSLLVRAALVVTGEGEALAGGWVHSTDGLVTGVGSGAAPDADQVLDQGGCVAMPGLVNAHDHFYQWATRGLADGDGLFGWLGALYPVWAQLDADLVSAAARAAIGRLLLAGCTLTSDHHYIFPRGRPGIFEALVAAARELGIRFQPCRGSMSLGASQGGLPPDNLVEDDDHILADTELLASKFHDPARGSMCRISAAPCSPFSVTPRLMVEAAAQARRLGLRLHTHLGETADEERYCLERFGLRPLELLEELGWVGEDVWIAHGIHFNAAEAERLAETRTGVAHCPSSNMRLGAGACPVGELLAAGVKVGLGVDGAASNEDYDLVREVHQALLLSRVRAAVLGSPQPAAALSAGDCWSLATAGGAACLGRDDCGRLAPGQCADIALYRIDDLGRSGIEEPLVALALAPPARAEAVVVGGRVVVRQGRLQTADEEELAASVGQASQELRSRLHA